MNVKKPVPSNKILLALQYWNGDRAAALKLASLLADIEPKHSDLADFLFVARFDSSHDQATINKVARKFNTFSHISKGRGTGWPHGCNDLFLGTIGWFYHKAFAAQIPHYKAVFTFEADGIPMRRDWIAGLHAEWDRVNAKTKVCQAGAWLPNGPDGLGTGHINGNCLITGDLPTVKWMMNLVGGVCMNAGWDWLLAPQFKSRGWSDIPGIRSAWRTRITEKYFLDGMQAKQIWYHGVKDSVGLQLCRKHLL